MPETCAIPHQSASFSSSPQPHFSLLGRIYGCLYCACSDRWQFHRQFPCFWRAQWMFIWKLNIPCSQACHCAQAFPPFHHPTLETQGRGQRTRTEHKMYSLLSKAKRSYHVPPSLPLLHAPSSGLGDLRASNWESRKRSGWRLPHSLENAITRPQNAQWDVRPSPTLFPLPPHKNAKGGAAGLGLHPPP